MKTYSSYQAVAVQQWEHTRAFFRARPVLTPADAIEGRERLELLESSYETLEHLQKEFEGALDRAA